MKYILLLIMFCPFFINGMQPANLQAINHDLALESGVGNIAAMRTLIGQGADVNYYDPQSYATPLYLASGWGNIEAMRLLLEAGADPNVESFLVILTLATPLKALLSGVRGRTITDRNQALDAIRLLLSYGADVRHPSVQAEITKYPALGQLLKEAGLAKLP